MKSIVLALFVLLTSWLPFSEFGINESNPKLNKRITKKVTRIWPNRTILLDTCISEHDKNCLTNGLTLVILAESGVKNHDYDTLGYIYQNRVYSCHQGGCSVTSNPGNSDKEYLSEFFDYFAVLDTDARVMKIDVYNYQATHGQEICSNGWLKQFVGFSGSEQLIYGKNIQAISGATISANAITYDINYRVSCLRNSLKM
ncbi:FMN-binding protein [Bacteroidota bacterium]